MHRQTFVMFCAIDREQKNGWQPKGIKQVFKKIKFGDIIASLNAAGSYLVGRGTQVTAGARRRGPGPMKAQPVHHLHQSPWPRRGRLETACQSLLRETESKVSTEQDTRATGGLRREKSMKASRVGVGSRDRQGIAGQCAGLYTALDVNP